MPPLPVLIPSGRSAARRRWSVSARRLDKPREHAPAVAAEAIIEPRERGWTLARVLDGETSRRALLSLAQRGVLVLAVTPSRIVDGARQFHEEPDAAGLVDGGELGRGRGLSISCRRLLRVPYIGRIVSLVRAR